MKQALFFAAFLVCCSPNSNVENNLIGKWNNSSVIFATKIDATNHYNVFTWDTVNFVQEIQFNATQFTLSYTEDYKTNKNYNLNYAITCKYTKSNDTLNGASRVSVGSPNRLCLES